MSLPGQDTTRKERVYESYKRDVQERYETTKQTHVS